MVVRGTLNSAATCVILFPGFLMANWMNSIFLQTLIGFRGRGGREGLSILCLFFDWDDFHEGL